MVRRLLVFTLCILPYSFVLNAAISGTPPKLTIVFVADSGSKGLIDKATPFLTDGIKFLQTNGINYTNVFHNNANCSTAPGHAAFLTGTFASYHGMVNNAWIDENNNVVAAELDPNQATSGVYNPSTGTIYTDNTNLAILSYYGIIASAQVLGVSPRKYKADTLSDQLVINSNPQQTTTVYSIAADPLPAVMMGGQLANVFWLDGVSGLFTTSQYYYSGGIPDWVVQFNNNHPVPPSFVWQPVYPIGSAAYNFPNAQNYEFSIPVPGLIPVDSTLFGQTLVSIAPPGPNFVFGAVNYTSGPLGIEVMFEFAEEIINRELNGNDNSNLVLFMNVASVDILATTLGMQTQEVFDVVYHIDQNLGEFIRFIYSKLPRSEVLFVFLADESDMEAIPELLKQQGFGLAMRTLGDCGGMDFFCNPSLPSPPFTIPPSLLDKLNTAMNTAFGTSSVNYWLYVIPPYLYVNLTTYNSLTPTQQTTLFSLTKDFLRAQPGFKDAWTFDELVTWPFEREDLARYFKLSLYRNVPVDTALSTPPQERRTGEIIFQVDPYNMLLTVSAGDVLPQYGQDHATNYNYDSHVPLYIYQHGSFARKTVSDPVIIQQLPISLSQILNVPRPSAAPVDVKPLPGLD